jgi:hypothetical protein
MVQHQNFDVLVEKANFKNLYCQCCGYISLRVRIFWSGPELLRIYNTSYYILYSALGTEVAVKPP